MTSDWSTSGNLIHIHIPYSCKVKKGRGGGEFHPRTGHDGTDGSTGTSLLSFFLGARRRWLVEATSRQLYPREWPRILYTWGWLVVWTSTENLAPTGIRSPDRPAHIESLYRLCYPDSHCISAVSRPFFSIFFFPSSWRMCDQVSHIKAEHRLRVVKIRVPRRRHRTKSNDVKEDAGSWMMDRFIICKP